MLDHKHSEHQIHDYNNQFEVARRKEKKKRKPLKPSQYAVSVASLTFHGKDACSPSS